MNFILLKDLDETSSVATVSTSSSSSCRSGDDSSICFDVIDDVTDVMQHMMRTVPSCIKSSIVSADDSWVLEGEEASAEEEAVGYRAEWRHIVPPKRLHVGVADPLGAHRQCDGAAVLPFAVDPKHNLVYFLLGRQAFNAANPLTGFRWSSFGGHLDAGEDVFTAAARECFEETMGELRMFTNDTRPLRSYLHFAHSLRNNEFLFSVKLLYMNGDRPCYYVVFVRQVPWDPSISHRFERTRKALTDQHGHLWQELLDNKHPAISHGSSGKPFVTNRYLEMDTVKWWSIPQLNNAVFVRKGILVNHLGEAEECRNTLIATLHIVLRFIITI